MNTLKNIYIHLFSNNYPKYKYKKIEKKKIRFNNKIHALHNVRQVFVAKSYGEYIY